MNLVLKWLIADAQVRVCRICDDEILAAATACPSCGALYHLECWQLETECPACRHRIEDAGASAAEPGT